MQAQEAHEENAEEMISVSLLVFFQISQMLGNEIKFAVREPVGLRYAETNPLSVSFKLKTILHISVSVCARVCVCLCV